MGGRPRRSRDRSFASVEREVRQLQAALNGRSRPSPPPCPHGFSATRYHAALRAIRADCSDLRSVADVLAALRLTLALEMEGGEWGRFLHDHLLRAVRRLRCQHADFSNATSQWIVHAEQPFPASTRGTGALLRRLDRLGRLDSLHFALWHLARSMRHPLRSHPAGLAVASFLALKASRPAGVAALRQLLLSSPRVAEAWRVRPAWLHTGKGLPWRRGGCLLLRLMRGRWGEVTLLLHDKQLDAAQRKVPSFSSSSVPSSLPPVPLLFEPHSPSL